MAEETVNNMQKQNMRKRSTVLKSVKQDNNWQLNLAFANAVHDPSDKFYGDDEDDNFPASYPGAMCCSRLARPLRGPRGLI